MSGERLAGRLRLCEAEHERDGNPMWVWQALAFLGEELAKPDAESVDMPAFILRYLAGAAAEIVNIDTKAKQRIAVQLQNALHLNSGGSQSPVADWQHRRADIQHEALVAWESCVGSKSLLADNKIRAAQIGGFANDRKEMLDIARSLFEGDEGRQRLIAAHREAYRKRQSRTRR